MGAQQSQGGIARDWAKLDSRHNLHPFTAHKDLRQDGVRVITHADGVYIYDSTGHRMLDGMAGLWCVQVGYGNLELADAAYEALRTLPFYNTFFQTTHPYVAQLCEALAEVTPEGLDNFHFANSGSEANDTAFKMIRYFWNLQGKPDKKIILSRERGYHGVTTAAASLSGIRSMHPQFDLPIPGIAHVSPAVYQFEEGRGLSEDDFAQLTANAVEEKILALGPNKVAAFVAEPVMGASGMMTPPAGYWPRINAICKKYDVLLWVDEVICGFGRTGQWFGSHTYGIEPDIVTMAKGMSSGYQPISAVALNARLNEAIVNAPSEMAHGFTWSGHPVASAVCVKNLEIMRRLELVGPVGDRNAAALQAELATLADHPLVGEVRGVGFLGAIEIVKNKETGERFSGAAGGGVVCRNHAISNGVMIRACGDTMVMSPPLVITPEQSKELIDAVRRALDATLDDLMAD
ncbi:MAG: aminotransferase [Sphingomonadaceae bacterium]|jgi:putrescine aminotransferase|nr:aminotransferase [Sphingomonadaceae bacterium]